MAQDYDLNSIDSDRFPDLAYMLRMREIMGSVGIPQDAYKLNIDEDMAIIDFDTERYRLDGMVNKLEAVELCEPGVGGTGNFVVSQRSVNLDRDGNVVEGRKMTSFDNSEDFAEHMRSAYAEHMQAKEAMREAGFEPIRPFVHSTSQAAPYDGPTKSRWDALREQSREVLNEMYGSLKYPDGDFDGDTASRIHKYDGAGDPRTVSSQIDLTTLLDKDVADNIEQPRTISTADRIARVLDDDSVSQQRLDPNLRYTPERAERILRMIDNDGVSQQHTDDGLSR